MNTIDYTNFKADNFVTDDRFVQWCLVPSIDEDLFWDLLMEQHPSIQQDVDIAKRMILDIHESQHQSNNSTIKSETWNQLDIHINKNRNKTPIYYIKRISAVAAMVLVLLIAYQWTIPTLDKETVGWQYYVNTSQKTEYLNLTDGSKLTLQPMASVRYPVQFANNKRELILEGEAFFDIKRNETKPFLIYAQNTLTKVLGTSFSIRSEVGEDVEVEVSTGKVAVYKHLRKGLVPNDDPTLDQTIVPMAENDTNTSYKIITQNQKVVFKEIEKILIKTIVESPKLIQKIEALPRTKFKNTALTEVFTSIENAYGINIHYNKQQLESCSVSTVIGKEPMLVQLQMICIALDLQMIESEGIITMSGRGCRD